MSGRRTRAAVKSATMATPLDAIKPIVDQNFASPKRKDCKLDTIPVSPLTKERLAKLPSNQATTAQTTNSKRNYKNAAGSKSKKSSPSITKFFPINGRNSIDNKTSKNAPTLNDSIILICDSPVLQKDENDFIKPDDPAKVTMNETKPNVEKKLNGSILLSPEAKSLQQSQIKQTTPHRIVCHQSPSKKQRLYVKDPVEVFSNLNIRDGSSPKIKSGNRARKNQQKTRRKLNVNEVENSENEKLITNGLDADATVPIVNGDDASKQLVNGKIDKNANKKPPNMEFVASKNMAATRTTQMTDFFPIRRSVRKTKQAVEQEQTRFIEIAIEKQLEDGLVVKDFGEKGRGIVAGRKFQRGEFVVEYIGELIDQAEADRREEEYAKKTDFGCYMYYFKHKEQQWCIDATSESGKLGRLVNHSRNGNLATKIISYKNKPHLVLLAKDDIKEGEELNYDYGDRRKEALIHHPWLAF